MARPGSAVSEVLKNKQTVAQSLPVPYEPGDLSPRLTPEDLPKPTGSDLTPHFQNQTPKGRAYEVVEPKFKYPLLAGKSLLKDEMLKRKGVDIGDTSLYPDGETKGSLKRKYQGGHLLNPATIEDMNKEFEARSNAYSDQEIVENIRKKRPAGENIADRTIGKYIPKDIDYDYEAAEKAGEKPDARGHMTSKYKLPNHITFSDDSIYSDKGAGQWRNVKGTWHFTPGATNLKHHSMEELRQYFRKYEPDAVLVEPK